MIKEYDGDIWELSRKIQDQGGSPPLIMIPTNGQIKKNGRAVMGAGLARQARDMFEDLDLAVADALRERGNVFSYLGTWIVGDYSYRLFSFPTKNHWREKSPDDLILTGMQYVQGLIDRIEESLVLLPRPGCGKGGRDWEAEVMPLVEPFAHDRIIFVTKSEDEWQRKEVPLQRIPSKS